MGNAVPAPPALGCWSVLEDLLRLAAGGGFLHGGLLLPGGSIVAGENLLLLRGGGSYVPGGQLLLGGIYY